MKQRVLSWMTCVLVLLAPMIANASLKEETMAPLEALAKAAEADAVKATINDSSIGVAMRIGDEIRFHIDVEQDAYITIVYIDSQGVIDIIEPDFGSDGNFLAAGAQVVYPSEDSGVTLTLEPPLGRDAVYIFATASRLDTGAFMPAVAQNQTPATVSSGEDALFEMEDSIKVAEFFAKAVEASNTPDQYSVALLESTVQGRDDGAEYSSSDIVAFFSARKYRSISKPKLDANILFHTNSADLTEQAKINLNEWGKSLTHPTLSESTFQIGGHTDDVGPAVYNRDLSERRAEAVRAYLASTFQIEGERLEVKAFGEDAPLVENTDAEARSLNRRVEFRRLSVD